MKIEKAAAIPLLTHDPYFSIWSASDRLNDSDPVHWTKTRQKMRGYLVIDDIPYCFLGKCDFFQRLHQTEVYVTATSTQYVFEHEKASFTITFTSPLLLDDPVLVSRPCSYVEMRVVQKVPASISMIFQLSADLVRETPGKIIGGSHTYKDFRYCFMGKAFQHPMGHSGDHTTIDWGYLYLASDSPDASVSYCSDSESLQGMARLSSPDMTGHTASVNWIVAYDDLLSICYFGEWKKAYWTTRYHSILDAIEASFAEYEEIMDKCNLLDRQLEKDAFQSGGNDYAFLCCMSYRHTIAAHKLISGENGELLFLSKENDSNGCIGTVDVTYPSAPLFMLYNPELLKGMLRPVFHFAKCPVWKFDFAPHDIGRYPYANGQVYGLKKNDDSFYAADNHAIYPFFYQFPEEYDIYDINEQMPTEECGNMIILTAAICLHEESAAFALPYHKILKQWADYLLKYGANPDHQLCTDDFSGHLAHNTNLSLKAILGMEGFAQISRLLGNLEDYRNYHAQAMKMAHGWESSAMTGDHYKLAFDQENSWSLKYNLVWDKLFHSRLFSKNVYEKELSHYLSKQNAYGVPLDSRAAYTKSDWILWCVSLTSDLSQRRDFIAPVAKYLKNTNSRVPFSDWYDTASGEYCQFIARSVQGGIFMPMLMDKKTL